MLAVGNPTITIGTSGPVARRSGPSASRLAHRDPSAGPHPPGRD